MEMGLVMAIVGVVITIVVVGFTLLVVVKVFRGLSQASAETQRLLQTGAPAPARILNIQMGGMTVTTGVQRHLQLHLQLEVHPPGGQPYQGQMTSMVSELQVPQLQPGAWIQVRYDPQNPAKMAMEAVGLQAQQPGGYGAAGAMMPMAQPAAAQQMRMPAGAKIGLIVGGLGALIGIIAAVAVVGVNFYNANVESTADDSSVCGQASACCKVISQNQSMCNNFKRVGMPEDSCRSSLQSFRQAAQAQGKSCP